jgi:hypothetical protein
MRKPFRWLIIGAGIVLVGFVGYSLKRSPGITWPYVRARLATIFLHRGMSDAAARRLLGEPPQKIHHVTIMNGVPAVSSEKWIYRFTRGTLTADFDNSNTVSGWRWGGSKATPGINPYYLETEEVMTIGGRATNMAGHGAILLHATNGGGNSLTNTNSQASKLGP